MKPILGLDENCVNEDLVHEDNFFEDFVTKIHLDEDSFDEDNFDEDPSMKIILTKIFSMKTIRTLTKTIHCSSVQIPQPNVMLQANSEAQHMLHVNSESAC